MSKKLTVRVIRIDPKLQKFAFVQLKGTRESFVGAIRASLRCQTLGHRKLVTFDDRRLMGTRVGENGQIVSYDAGPEQLFACANANAGDNLPGWRLRGGEPTAGPSILFGQGIGGGMVDVPVDLEWLRQQLVWTDPAETLEPTA